MSAGTARSLTLSPASLTFGTVEVGTASAVQVLSVNNPGSDSVNFATLMSSGEFSQTNSCGAGLVAGATCTLSIQFTPATSGVRTGLLFLLGSAPGDFQIVTLLGSGTTAPQASLSTQSLYFSRQSIGSVSPSQTVTLTNSGLSPLTISSIGASAEFTDTTTCRSSLAPAASCIVTVAFDPAGLGVRTGALTIVNDSANSTQIVQLTGNGATLSSGISAVWANEGGDKVSQDELRASRHVENLTGNVINRAWDGTTIKLSGAHNEVVAFNLVLEAATQQANNVTVTFNTLTGPDGATIASSPTSGDGVFNWVGRPIELFFTRYLQITGLSYFGYEKGDERQIPVRFQRPWSGNGVGVGSWTDRPDHNKFYPDIMVPLELNPSFNIALGQNQSIWSDIYVPKNVPSGLYSGQVVVQENGTTTYTIPVQLNVQNFSLPDAPTAKTMVYLDTTDIEWRYVTGYGGYAQWNTPGGLVAQNITDAYFELFHRHKISLIGENECPVYDHPCDSGVPRLSGSLYTGAHGYDGPGVNTSSGVYSIGTYSSWGYAQYSAPEWRDNQSVFQSHMDNWVTWFDANLPSVDYFIYLEDEPPASDYGQVETWSEWINGDPGAGHRMHSMATLNAVLAQTNTPSLDIPVSHASIGTCPNDTPPCNPTVTTQNVANSYHYTPGRKFWMYNDGRPGVGTFDTEDDGISPRTFGWTQFKKSVDRWYYWYANLNANIDWFTQATTWGSDQFYDNVIGWTSNNGKTNGDGVLVYPGTDLNHPADSYGVHGAFASLRLKEWRRGIQDADYLALANQIDPVSTQQIMNTVVPQVLWEYQTTDPSWYNGFVSWSSNPDNWETGRAALAQIIANWCASNPGTNACTSN